nr:hypothetical protein [uncultured Rhodopila sp.]
MSTEHGEPPVRGAVTPSKCWRADANLVTPCQEIRQGCYSLHGIYRDRIEHEDNLIGQRSSWFLMAQSFLLGSFTLLCVDFLKSPPIASQPAAHYVSYLVFVLPLIGLIMSFVHFVTILVPMMAIEATCGKWHELKCSNKHLSDIIGIESIKEWTFIQRLMFNSFNAAVLCIPLVFLLLWGSIAHFVLLLE